MEDFDLIKNVGEVYYKEIGEIYCPYLKDTVHFNAEGISHLKFKKRDVSRSMGDQYMRFKLLGMVPEIISQSHTLQGILETKRFEYIKINSRWENILKPVTYYEFIAVVKRDRIKVIVKQVENSQKIFWSIIPSWGMNKSTKTRVLHEGEPEED
ncbi:MAG: hypothetical protein JWM92_453 [Candidatus Nomurabacteria bacterium]|nr:hypothetical protein [Candidatus Nomurabacteria bacterium]